MSLVALVTGASRGIGRAIARELAEQDYAIVVNFARSEEAAQQLVIEIADRGGRAVAIGADVASADERRRLIDCALEHFGRLDLLVNNAGITSPGRRDILELDEASWDLVLSTNLKGPFFLAQAAAEVMLRQIAEGTQTAGKIINISSISAYAVSTDRADYCISKAGLGMLTRLFAARLADAGIQVFEVCPGVVATDMTAPVRQRYEQRVREGLAPMRRWGRAEEVARGVAALAADYFPFSTGNCLHIDGGFHIRRL